MNQPTLKRISVSQVRLGMCIHRLEGHWLSHPFWRSSFMIDMPTDLDKLRSSGVGHVWIDLDKGVDVLPAQAAESPCDDPWSAPTVALSQPARPERLTMEGELLRASTICRKASEQVRSVLADVRLGKIIDPDGCRPVVEDICNSVERNNSALLSLARLKTADTYSYLHSVAVCALMVALARQLGLSEQACREAGLAGLLHDIGKATIPLDILNKPGRLTEQEFAMIKTHPESGHRMLLDHGGVPAAVLDVCIHHHERPDGRGYPHGLAGDQLSQIARMASLCDVYDAITSRRPYKEGWDPAHAIAQMASWEGQFDTTVLCAFVQTVGIYPAGSLVRLASNKLAVVRDQNPQKLHAPTVCIFFSVNSGTWISPRLLDLSRSSDHIVAREDPAQWGFKGLEELWLGATALQANQRTTRALATGR